MGTDTNSTRIGVCPHVFVLLLVACACAWGGARWRWAAAGDSLTRRDGFEYPYQLAGARFNLIDLADPGARLWDVVDAQLPRIVGARAQLVTLEVGTNDILQPLAGASDLPMHPAAFRQILDWAVAFLQLSQPRRVIVLGTLPPIRSLPATRRWSDVQLRLAEAAAAGYNRAIRDVAMRRGCRLWTFPSLPSSRFQSDGFHPDRAGHALIARTLARLLPQGPAPPASGPGPSPPPLTCFPRTGPPGAEVVLRGAGVDAVRRVVWFAGGGFRMCPVVDRQAGMLASSIPNDATGTLTLWAVVTRRPAAAPPNFPLGRFRVRAEASRTGVAPVGGVWLGVLHRAGGGRTALRLDLDQAGATLHGVAGMAADGRAAYRVAAGSVQGRRVRLSFGSASLAADLLPDRRGLAAHGAWTGLLRRW